MPVLSRFLSRLPVLTACALLLVAFRLSATESEPLRRDVLGATLAGEFALQAGRLDEAIGWYLDAALAAEGDAALAERATRIALLGNDDRRAAEALALWRRRAPAVATMHAAEATLALRDGRQRVARRELETLLRSDPQQGWRYALIVLAGSRDQTLAARLLGRLVDSGRLPDELPVWLAFGDLAQRLDQPGLSERIFERIAARFPGEPRVALLRARRMRGAGDADGARAVLAGIEEVAGRAPELRYAIAAEYDALGDLLAAERALAAGPQDARTQMLRASLLARAEDKEALGRLYEELKRDAAAPDPMQRLLLGQTAEYLEHHAEALEWYESVPGGGERWQARLRAANVLYELGRGDEAWAALRALQSDAGVDEVVRRSGYLLEAELREKAGDAEGEADAYARGLAAWPDAPDILYSRALMWERRDDIARAEADFRQILIADPGNVAALNALGYTLADRTTRYAEALELIDRARVAEPDNAAIIDSYGWVLYRLGRHEEALVELRRAFTMQKDAEIAAHVAEVLWVLGRRDEARRYFDEARRIDPENRSLLRALEGTGA